MEPRQPTCNLQDIRYRLSLYAATSIDGHGVPDQDEAVANLMDCVREWDADEYPYYCPNCDEDFKYWEHAKEHVEGRK